MQEPICVQRLRSGSHRNAAQPPFCGQKFNQPMPRLNLQHPVPITRLNRSAATATFPWTIKINGQPAHSMNANRISLLLPMAGETEHRTLVNGGGGCDHPIHLHFEEGVTLDRGSNPIPATGERLVRKDVWRLRAGGSMTFQVQFGEDGSSYVNHRHNTVHEDSANADTPPAPDRTSWLASGGNHRYPEPNPRWPSRRPKSCRKGIQGCPLGSRCAAS